MLRFDSLAATGPRKRIGSGVVAGELEAVYDRTKHFLPMGLLRKIGKVI